jgi:hypothetical protein
MTIKKPIPAAAAAEPAPVSGGATIADRFKLDVPDPNAKKSAGKGSAVTLAAALLALGVAGVLTFILFQHWEFLKAA